MQPTPASRRHAQGSSTTEQAETALRARVAKGLIERGGFGSVGVTVEGQQLTLDREAAIDVAKPPLVATVSIATLRSLHKAIDAVQHPALAATLEDLIATAEERGWPL